MATATQAILGIERRMVRDFNAGKIDQLLAAFHPRVAGFSSTRQKRISGRGALRKTFNYYRQASSRDRKSTRLNSSHSQISYAVFCLKKKKTAVCVFRPQPSLTRRTTLPRGSVML